MPNEKPGDHPLTDITVHRRVVYGEAADSLIREIASLGGTTELDALLLGRFSPHRHVDKIALLQALTALRSRILPHS